MPPEAVRVLEAISMWLLLGLALPKRRLPRMTNRLSALGRGGRQWLYGAPLGWSRTAGRRRFRAESLRVVELGVPLWVIARVLEERSGRRRLEARAPWMDGRAVQIYSRATEGVGDPELAARLELRGFPQLAGKATPSVTLTRPALPLGWWTESKSDGLGNGIAPGLEEDSNGLGTTVTAVNYAKPPVDHDLLAIRTFGRLELLWGDVDLAERLLQKPVLAFIWLYLLVRALARPDDRLTRAELADELTPGLAADRQRKRLRDRLSDMVHGEIPAALAERIQHNDDVVRIDLTRCALDYTRLVQCARQASARDGLMSREEVEDIERALATSDGEFLPEWDRLEGQVNGHRGAAGDLVRLLRQQADESRVNLLGALGSSHLAWREPHRAIPALERALEHSPDREDLARALRTAYLESGMVKRATEVQRAHDL